MYQRQGKTAFKKDLSNTIALCRHLENPEQKFKSIHVAGTNGKGSSAHMIAAMLQQVGLKVGLYTSPHLKDFRERIRISGQPISQDVVIDFIASNKAFIEKLKPSFFEMTVALAFESFANASVDIAVIEVGLGGRLDSTNVITPEVSLITNIGYDHMDMLGNTLPEIAHEKAGIIKPGVPVVIGEYQKETAPVFEQIAQKNNALLTFAEHIRSEKDLLIPCDLMGTYQQANKLGAMTVLEVLAQSEAWHIDLKEAQKGLTKVAALTGLKGRWQIWGHNPLMICDTGHNQEAFDYLLPSLAKTNKGRLYMVLGFVNDKNVSDLLQRLPQDAQLIFTQANIPRAMPLTQLKALATSLGIEANYIQDVNEAIAFAKMQCMKDDLIFIGGSTFVVAEIEEL